MLLLLVQTFSTWVTIIDFKINQNFIAAKLCQNRNRPKMHCNGQCALMKKMRQQEKQDPNVPGPLKLQISSTVLSSKTFFAAVNPSLSITNKVFIPLVNTGRPVDRTSPIFHPPAV
jgi:hypothetical protein